MTPKTLDYATSQRPPKRRPIIDWWIIGVVVFLLWKVFGRHIGVRERVKAPVSAPAPAGRNQTSQQEQCGAGGLRHGDFVAEQVHRTQVIGANAQQLSRRRRGIENSQPQVVLP